MSDKKNIKIKNVLVIGLGLIGASLCRSLRNNINYEKVFGYDCNEEVIQYAINNYEHALECAERSYNMIMEKFNFNKYIERYSSAIKSYVKNI